MLAVIVTFVFLGITAGLAWYLIANDHGEKEPIYALWTAAGFGVVAVVLALILEELLLSTTDMNPGAPLGLSLINFLGVGVIEETCKFAPLALFIFGRRYFNEHTDGVIYFAIAGSMFALLENIEYTLFAGGTVGLTRVVLTPVFHAATTGIVGYFLIKGKLKNGKPWYGISALGVAMVVHGLYDFFLSTGNIITVILALLTVATVSIMLFITYSRATRADQRLGLSVVGNNSFCRSCGAPNPKHNLYCARCGQRA